MPEDIGPEPVRVDPDPVIVVPEATEPAAAAPEAAVILAADREPPAAAVVPTGAVVSTGGAPWAHVANPVRRRALMPWAVVAGVVVVLGAGAVGLTYTPVFHAKTISVSGEARLSEQRILKIAGIGPGTDVFHADLAGAERRLEKNPWIANAVITRHLPSSLSVVITERVPVALTRSADGSLGYLALDGTVLAPAHGKPILPEVKAAPGASADPSMLATGAAVAKALPPSLLPQVASISVDPAGSVVLGMRSGVTATYGDGSDLAAKGQALKAVLTYAAQHGGVVASVDVEVPGAPTAVFSHPPTATP